MVKLCNTQKCLFFVKKWMVGEPNPTKSNLFKFVYNIPYRLLPRDYY